MSHYYNISTKCHLEIYDKNYSILNLDRRQ
nr:MAG TPA: hypothetical protein [Caudoviricetes sp.]